MKKILITGGCGFIGSHFVRMCLKTYKDCLVINYDKLTYSGNLNNVKDLHGQKNYQFVKGDVQDRILLETAAEGCDAMIHFAAETHVDRSIDNAADFLNTNILGTQVVLDVVRACKIPNYVQISTDEVYGSFKSGSAREESLLKPSNPYSASKAAADLLGLSYHETHKTPIKIVRPTNNFGPYQYPEKVIPLFITNLIEGKTIPIYGKGLNVRTWIYVEDTCRAILMILEKGKNGDVYNVSSEKELKNIDLAHKILKLLGQSKSQINYVQDRPGHDFRYSLKCDKIKKLGWKTDISFDRALDATVQWYREHQEWWGALKGDKFTVKK
jgi:dTDP-glucose 4,6-dehydratase